MRRALACTSCTEGMIALGAVRVHEPRVGSLLDACEVHPGASNVHATNLLEFEPAIAVLWMADEERKRRESPMVVEVADAATAPLVAELAATLLAAGRGIESTDPEILQSVVVARQLLAAAKGEAIR